MRKPAHNAQQYPDACYWNDGVEQGADGCDPGKARKGADMPDAGNDATTKDTARNKATEISGGQKANGGGIEIKFRCADDDKRGENRIRTGKEKDSAKQSGKPKTIV